MAEVESVGGLVSVVAQRHVFSKGLLYNWRSAGGGGRAVPPAEFVQLGVVTASGDSQAVSMPGGAVCPRGAGLALAERVGVIEIDLPGGIRVRVDSGVNEKALRRVVSAVRGLG